MAHLTNKHTPRHRDFRKYKAYFCHAKDDKEWVLNVINMLESDRYKLKCAEYDRDCLGGMYVEQQMEMFMENSDFIVIVLSPNFLESGEVYQLYLAIEHSKKNNEGNIIPVLYKICDIPTVVKVFGVVDATRTGWEKVLIERMWSPAMRFPKNKDIDTRDNRVSIDALRSSPTRHVMSQPLPGQASNKLSEHNFCKVKTLSIRRRCGMNFMKEANNGGSAPSRGDSAQVESNRETKDRTWKDDVKLQSLTYNSELYPNRLKDDSLQQLSFPKEEEEHIWRRRMKAAGKRRSVGNIVPGNINPTFSLLVWKKITRRFRSSLPVTLESYSQDSKSDNTSVRLLVSMRAENGHRMYMSASDDERSDSSHVTLDRSSIQCEVGQNTGIKRDGTCLKACRNPQNWEISKESTEETDLMHLQDRVPVSLLRAADCAKRARIRKGTRRERIDASRCKDPFR